jgi:hypothetical protein
MLRALVALLLLANALFFAWSQGWLGGLVAPPHAGETEPGRLAQQVRPDNVRVLPVQAASAAVAAATFCVETPALPASAASAVRAAVLAAGVPEAALERRDQAAEPTWLVYMGRFADPAGLRTKTEELKRLKLNFEELRSGADSALLPGLVLSRHDRKEAADAALATLNNRGVRTARVVQLPAAAPTVSLRVAKASPEVQRLLGAAKASEPTANFTRCPKG